MKVNFKKYLLLFLLVVGIFISTNSVNAETYKGDFIYGENTDTKVYINKKQPNGYTKWKRSSTIVQKSTGKIVYCLQPMVDIIDGAIYNVTDEDYAGAQNLTSEQYDRIKLLAYYGYGYGNHTSTDWVSVTQVLIWRTTRPDLDIYFSWESNAQNRDDSIFVDKIDELNKLVANHYTRPSFNMNNIDMVIGKNQTIVDTNGVLSNYKIRSKTNVDASISGNNLNVKANSVGTGEVIFEKDEKRFNEKPIIFYAIDSQNIIRPGDPSFVLAKININIVGGKVKINKLDSETNDNKPLGEATLKGAEYGIFTELGEKVATIITDENGKATSDFLPDIGKYYIQEIKASKGYELDSRKYFFELTNDSLEKEVNVYENVIKMNYNLTKVIAQEETGSMIPESNVKFGFYNSNGELYQEVSTDNNGKLSITLPYGKYIVKQLTNQRGLEKLQDFEIIVEKTENVDKVFADKEITAKLKVIKIDKDTKEVIKRSGIKFKIYDVENEEYICQKITYPKVANICEFETDENGEFITPKALKSGTYKLEEIDQSIDGYLWNQESIVFEIDENANLINDSDNGIIFETNFENKKVNGKIVINKVGEKSNLTEDGYTYTKESLNGIKFCLYSKNDEEIKCGKTNNNGILEFNNLELGSYYIKEVETLDGYILDDSKYNIELKYKDQYTPVVEYETLIENKLKKGTLEFTKTDFSESKTLPNTLIEIYTEDDKLIFSKRTDENGKIIIKDLPIGKYYILESEAPVGYLLNPEKMYFEIKENNEVVKSSLKDEIIKGTLEFSKIDFSTSDPLPNTLIEIYDELDNLVYSGRTDEEGKIIIEELEYGKYYILESEAPVGYLLNPEKMYFEITENGEIVKAVMEDEIIKVPDTSTNENHIVEIIGASLIIIGIGLIIYEKRKK